MKNKLQLKQYIFNKEGTNYECETNAPDII
jgi:hypothetical protein